MEFSASNYSDEEKDITNPTTFETNEESVKDDPQKINYKKWINSESDISHISHMIKFESESSTDKESSSDENNENEKEENIKNNKKEDYEENEDDTIAKEEKADNRNEKINYLFIWTEGGNEVKITGSFCDWKIKIDMAKDQNDNLFKCQIPLDNKIYQFKFIADNEWKCSAKYPIKKDNSGNINNYIDLTNYSEKIENIEKKPQEKNEKAKISENMKETDNNKNKNKIKRKDSIYSSQFPSNDSITPSPLPNKRYYQSFKLDKFSRQFIIGNEKYLNYKEKYSFSSESSCKPIYFLGHVNLNHLISSKNKKKIYLKNCMSFRYREKACTVLYYK